MRDSVKAALGAVAVNILWGLSFIASKIALSHGFTPFSLAFFRYVLAVAALLPVAKKRGALKGWRTDFVPMLAAAVAGVTLYFFFEYNGVARIEASTASLIIASIPVLQLVTDALLHGRRFRLLTWAGAAASVAGVYLLSAYGQKGGGSALGLLFMLGACLCWVTYNEIADGLMKRHDTFFVTFETSVLAMGTLLPCAIFSPPDWGAINPAAVLSVAFLGVLCSAVGYLLYNHSIRALSPARTALFLNLNPIAGCLGGVLILGETLTAPQLLGGAIILASLLLVNRRSEKEGNA